MINYGFNIKVGGNAAATMNKLVALSKQLDAAFKKCSTSTVKSTTNITKATQKMGASFSKQIKDMQKEAAKFNTSMSQMSASFTKAQTSMTEIASRTAASLPVKVRKGFGAFYSEAARVFGDTRSKLGQIWGGNPVAATMGKLGLSIGAVDIGRRIISAGGNAEATLAQLEFALKDRGKAEYLNSQLNEFAKNAPIPISQIKQQAAFLAPVFGDQTFKYFKQLGDVVSGSGGDFGNIAYNFSQIKSMGRTTGMDLRQFAMQNIPIYQELAKVIGKTEQDVIQLSSEGKITFDMVAKAFKNMTKEGGKYYGAMEAKAHTFQGQWQIISNKMQLIFSKIFIKLQPYLKQFSNWIEKIIDDFDNWWPKVKKIGKTLLWTFAGYQITTALAKFYQSIKVIGGALKGLNAISLKRLDTSLLSIGKRLGVIAAAAVGSIYLMNIGHGSNAKNRPYWSMSLEDLKAERDRLQNSNAPKTIEEINQMSPAEKAAYYANMHRNKGNDNAKEIEEINRIISQREGLEKAKKDINTAITGNGVEDINNSVGNITGAGSAGLSGISGKLIKMEFNAPIAQVTGGAMDQKYTPQDIARIAADELVLILKQVAVS
jgi:tape measure domain-containing protein